MRSAMKPLRFNALEATGAAYYLWLAGFGALTLVGILAAWHMEHEGHYVTGMSNQVVWGMPHILAIFMILVASGALNVASVASVFGKRHYAPLSRLSGLVALAFLIGGLAVLVLDLGRPDRLIVAMTYYNFKSIFAWNIFLYTGFFAVVIIYLWTMFERRMKPYSRISGMTAFLWRLILTTGTGSIFGFLVARQAYDAALMAPLFIIISLVVGMAAFILILAAVFHLSQRLLGTYILFRLRNLLGVMVAASLYFTLVYHLANLYATEHHGIESFILRDGGIYTWLFWGGQVVGGGLIPLLLFYLKPFSDCRIAALFGTALIIGGVLAQLYVIIIGGQAYPLVMFPGMEESSSFFDGVVAAYTPSLPEILLGVGGVGFACLILTFMLAALEFLPESLADKQFGIETSD